MRRLVLLAPALAILLVLAAVGSALTKPRWSRSVLVVVQVEQLCPGGPRSYRLVGERDSLALEVEGAQRFALGETVEVHKP